MEYSRIIKAGAAWSWFHSLWEKAIDRPGYDAKAWDNLRDFLFGAGFLSQTNILNKIIEEGFNGGKGEGHSLPAGEGVGSIQGLAEAREVNLIERHRNLVKDLYAQPNAVSKDLTHIAAAVMVMTEVLAKALEKLDKPKFISNVQPYGDRILKEFLKKKILMEKD